MHHTTHIVPGRGPGLGYRIRRALVDAMLLLYERGLLNLKGGNASAAMRLHDGALFIYITPGGAVKPRLGVMDIAVMSLDGHVYWGKPSSEYRLHLEAYKATNATAVVHAHNPAAVLADRMGVELDPAILGVEARYYLGPCVSRVPELPPGTVELARAAATALRECPVAVMSGHGAVAVGLSEDPVRAVYEAVDRLEALEDLARAALAEAGEKLQGRRETSR